MASISRLLGKSDFILDVGAGLGSFVLKCLHLTLHKYHCHRDRETTESLFREDKKVIFCFWHGRLLMLPFSTPVRNVAIMISQHRDGDFVSRFAEKRGLQSIRGSATRGGLVAVKKMIGAHKGGQHLAITPDGPKGPKHQVKSGVIEMAKLTGSPILPLTFGAFPRRVLSSWDEFVIPLPFSTCIFLWGRPLSVPADADREMISEAQQVLQEEMMAITTQADQLSREIHQIRRCGQKDVEAELIAQGLRKASQ
jgi:lysophospholipid acyltransferase (LPLAT)-like uncharacterized protein